MPNLQSWLNAWVKVNSKTQGSSTAPPVPTSPRTQHHGKSSSRGATPGSPTMTTINAAAGGALLSERSGRENEALSSTKSASVLIDQLRRDPSLRSVGPTVATSSTTQQNSRYDGPPLEVRTSLRKHNSKKHKRRLHRTNSFSDLIREQARSRSTRTGGKHVSVERTHRRHSYQVQPTAITTKQRQRFPPPPPTLHHSLHHFVEPGEPMGVDHASDGSSVHSISPSETAITQRRSNTHHKHHESSNIEDYIATNGQHIYVDNNSNANTSSVDHSNTALFGVASFFGTEIDERRPTTASTGSRHRTHAAQHGLEDEQPSYLQPYLQEDSDHFHSLHNNPLPSSTATAPSINYTTYKNTHTSSSSLSFTRLNHSHFHTNRISSSNNNNQVPPIHHNDRAYPPLPPHRRTNTSSSKNAHPTHKYRRGSAQPPPEEAPLPPPPPPPPPDESAFVIGGVRLPFFSRSNPATTSSSSNSAREDPTSNDKVKDNANSNPFGVGEPNCKGCQIAKAELQITQDSLEYMRTLAISKEFSCGECGKSNCIGGRTLNQTQTVKNASAQLSETTIRHKKQIEQLIKERHDMHQKLEKVSNLSRHLNAESSQRVAESQDLKRELEQVRTERNQMAGELEQLKATVEVYEKEREEHRLVQEKLTTYEDEGLRQAEQAIAQRDDIITKLSSRLTTTLDTLALEREQQRQRRQIIFPPTKTQSTESAGNNESEEIRRLREQLLQSQQALESLQLEAKQKETALLFRCETLESQLEKARESDSKVATKETHYLSGRNGWEIR